MAVIGKDYSEPKAARMEYEATERRIAKMPDKPLDAPALASLTGHGAAVVAAREVIIGRKFLSKSEERRAQAQ